MRQVSRTRGLGVAMGVLGAAYAAFVISACGGDDTVSPVTGADASKDVTLSDVAQDTAQPPADNNAPDVQGDTNPPANTCPGATDAASLDDAQVQAGLAAVLAFKCAGCHQSTPADAGLVLNGRTTSLIDGGSIFPKNLTPDPDAGIGCWTDPQITNAILNAIDDQDASLCVMPKFATRGMDAGTAASIAAFLRTLPASGQVIPETVCPVPVDGGGDASDAGSDAGTDADAADDASDAAADG